MTFRSARARLTLGNVALLGLILGVFAVLLRYGAEARLNHDRDRDLATRAQRAIARAEAASNSRVPPSPPVLPAGTITSVATIPVDALSDPAALRFASKTLDLRGRGLLTNKPDAPWDAAAFRRSAKKGESVYVSGLLGPVPVRIYSTPLSRRGKVIGVVQTAASVAEDERDLGRLTRLLLTLIPVALLAATVGGLAMTARVLRPVREMTQAAGSIEARNLSGRLPVVGRDEFGMLASTFNGMLERLEAAFEQQKRFTADASHELRTPLTAIKSEVSLALSGGDRDAAQYRRALEGVGDAANRMDRIVQDLLLLARSDGRKLPMDMRLLELDDVLRAAATAAAGRRITDAPITLQPIPAHLYVVGDAHYLERVFVNLLENSRRHTPPGGQITIAAEEGDNTVTVTVTDTGDGIAPEHLPHVFESFYRADASRTRTRDDQSQGGTGLGLTIVKSIVEAHGGSVTIDSEPGIGTTVSVTLLRARLDD